MGSSSRWMYHSCKYSKTSNNLKSYNSQFPKQAEKVLLVFMKSQCNGVHSLPISLHHETVSAGGLALRRWGLLKHLFGSVASPRLFLDLASLFLHPGYSPDHHPEYKDSPQICFTQFNKCQTFQWLLYLHLTLPTSWNAWSTRKEATQWLTSFKERSDGYFHFCIRIWNVVKF